MRRIIVCLKQAVDVAQLKVDAATRQLVTASAPRKMSDFDKNALEEAVRLKEKLGDTEVFTVTVCSEDAKSVLREALAIGADKAYSVNDAAFSGLDTFGTAYVLAEALRKIGGFDLVLCGETSLDSFSGLVGSRLAELLGLPLVSSVRKISVEGECVVAERSLEDAVETVKACMPAVVSVTREINQPRIPSLMMIMKASKKEIVAWSMADLGVSKELLEPKIEVVEVLAPKTERKKIRIKGENATEIAENLAKALVQEGVVGR
ncbi:MAG: electron transfer flavoprotein subunit beta/FixA family protein [Candidatus Bathyarchaeota archaeon]|nr:electron transfer flavoprotein subunit beta/FixA family protein [Candidatus Bathyarchaeota archaeon]